MSRLEQSPRTTPGSSTPATDPSPRLALVLGALLIVYVVWGSTYLGIRIVVEEAPPLSAMGVRFVIAGLVLGGVLAVRGGLSRLRVTRREFAGAALLGLLLPFLGNGLVAVAESHGATSGFTALLIAVVPLIIVVLRTAEGDRPRPQSLLGVLIGFAGLAVLLLVGRGGAEGTPLGPALVVLLAASFWALGSFLQPRLTLPRDPFVVAVWEMILGGLMMLAVAPLVGERVTGGYSAQAWWALVYLILIGSVVAFTAYVWLVAHAPISLVATYAYVNPVIAVLLGWLVLSEEVLVATLVGGTIVVASVALVINAERRR